MATGKAHILHIGVVVVTCLNVVEHVALVDADERFCVDVFETQEDV